MLTSKVVTFSTGIARGSVGPDHPEDYAAFLMGVSDNRVYGYTLGGLNTDAGVSLTVCYRLTFSSQTLAARTTGDLSDGKSRASAVSDGALYGYFSGGRNDFSSTINACDRMTFSTSVTAAYTQGNLSQARRSPAGLSDFAV